MPKTLIARNVASISSVRFVAKDGLLTSVPCQIEVNYGSMGLSDSVDVWTTMNAAQKAQLQNVYDAIVNKVNHAVMD
jgi:hypothetical protein